VAYASPKSRVNCRREQPADITARLTPSSPQPSAGTGSVTPLTVEASQLQRHGPGPDQDRVYARQIWPVDPRHAAYPCAGTYVPTQTNLVSGQADEPAGRATDM
jgi:hypothetical protein